MNIIRLLPVFFSTLLFSAHCLRNGSPLWAGVSIASPLLLLFPKRWSARVVQLFLILASLEWLRTLFEIIKARSSMSMPWTRLAIILGSVAVFTAASACVFFARSLKKRYKLDKPLNSENS